MEAEFLRYCSRAWHATKQSLLKGYPAEDLRKSLAFSLLAAYHSYVFFAAALSILTLSGNLILAWFITWFQEVRNSNMDTNARDVSLGYYLAVLTRCWLLIELASELLRCVLWFVEDAWQLETFRTYRQVLLGYGPQSMGEAQQDLTAAQCMVRRPWVHSDSFRWWLDLIVQLLLYSTLDVIPLLLSMRSLLNFDVQNFLSTLFASGCSIALIHVALLYVAWVLSDVIAKVSWRPEAIELDEEEAEEVLEDLVEEQEDAPLKPAHLCALFGGALTLSWLAFVKLLLFMAMIGMALQRDVMKENPFWLIAALLLGIAFWHSMIARGLQTLGKCLSSVRCASCDSTGQRQWLLELQQWGDRHAGMTVAAQRYDLAILVLLLQIALFGNFRWALGAIFLLLVVFLLLLRRGTLSSLGQWRGLLSLLESIGFVAVSVLLNTIYSWAAGLGVLLMALVLQCLLGRHELRAWRTSRAVTLGLHCSLVVIVAICMWSMQGGSGWSGLKSSANTGEYPFCHLRWPLGHSGTQEFSLIDFADMCAMTNLGSGDFNETLKSRFPGWTLVYEHRASDSHVYGYNDWTTFFELAGPGDTTIFAVRGTQSPLDVMQDLNIFTPVAVTQIAAYFGPDLTSSVTRTVFQVFSGLPSIDKDFYEVLLSHVRQRVSAAPERRFYITGHSLGGGLAKLVALEVGQKSVTFASPGLQYTSQMLLSESAVTKDELLASGDRLGTVVVPEHDLVSRVDHQLGAQLGIACEKNPFSCHSLQHIIHELHEGCESF